MKFTRSVSVIVRL